MKVNSSYKFLAQLAHFDTYDRCIELQESFHQVASSLQSYQALEASALVGRKVLVHGDILELGAKSSLSVSLDIVPGMSCILALIYAASGALIKTIALGTPDPGLFQFIWDGLGEQGTMLSQGLYKVKVRALFQGEEVNLNTMIFANVDSVTLEKRGAQLTLNVAGVGPMSLRQVKQISI